MREFQQWLFLRILATIACSSLVGALILYVYARHEVGVSLDTVKIVSVSDLLLPVITAGALVSMISGSLLALFLPQKIAGPIYRIEKNLKAFQNGDLTVTTALRSGDILQNFAGTIDETVKTFREDIIQIKAIHTDLRQSLANNDIATLSVQLDKGKAILDRLTTEISVEKN